KPMASHVARATMPIASTHGSSSRVVHAKGVRGSTVTGASIVVTVAVRAPTDAAAGATISTRRTGTSGSNRHANTTRRQNVRRARGIARRNSEAATAAAETTSATWRK